MGKGSNIFTHTAGVLACQGIHWATVISTEYVGEKATKYGKKDFQMFVLQVKQFNAETGDRETAEIHQQYHRSFSPKSSLIKFLAGFGYNVKIGDTFDFDDLVGKTVNIIVTHSQPDANGVVHANIKVLPPRNGSSR